MTALVVPIGVDYALKATQNEKGISRPRIMLSFSRLWRMRHSSICRDGSNHLCVAAHGGARKAIVYVRHIEHLRRLSTTMITVRFELLTIDHSTWRITYADCCTDKIHVFWTYSAFQRTAALPSITPRSEI